MRNLPEIGQIFKPSILDQKPELFIQFTDRLNTDFQNVMDNGHEDLPPEILSWMNGRLRGTAHPEMGSFDDIHQIFRTLIPFKFLPDEIGIQWGRYREFTFPQTEETLIVQPYTFASVQHTHIFEQTQLRIDSDMYPDPFFIAVKRVPLVPLSGQEIAGFHNLSWHYWNALMTGMKFQEESARTSNPTELFYEQSERAVNMFKTVFGSTRNVVEIQHRTTGLPKNVLALFYYPHAGKAAEFLSVRLRDLLQETPLRLTENITYDTRI